MLFTRKEILESFSDHADMIKTFLDDHKNGFMDFDQLENELLGVSNGIRHRAKMLLESFLLHTLKVKVKFIKSKRGENL